MKATKPADLINDTLFPIFELDLAGRFIFGNKAAEVLVGYTREELIGRSFQSVISSSKSLVDGFLQVLKVRAGKIADPYEIVIKHKSGKEILCTVVNAPVMKDNKVVGVHGIVIKQG